MALKDRTKNFVSALVVSGLLVTYSGGSGPIEPAAASTPTVIIWPVQMDTAQGKITFSTTVTCVGPLNFPPRVGYLRVESDLISVRIPWLQAAWDVNEYAPGSLYNQQGFRDFKVSWNLDDPQLQDYEIDRLLSSKRFTVQAESASCNSGDINFYSSREDSFAGPRTEVRPKSIASRQPVSLGGIGLNVDTFNEFGERVRVEVSDLYETPPVCEIDDSDSVPLGSQELLDLSAGDLRDINCSGGELKDDGLFRSSSIIFSTGKLRILGESEWALAPEHFSSLNDANNEYETNIAAAVSTGPSDLVYVTSEFINNGEPAPVLSRLGALVAGNGKSLSDQNCYLFDFSTVVSSQTERFAVAAGWQFSAELVRLSFDENSARCDFVAVPEDSITDPIRSMIIEDRNGVLALHGETISRITMTDPDPSQEFFQVASIEDFGIPVGLNLFRIAADSGGKLWGASTASSENSTASSEIRVYELTLEVKNGDQPATVRADLKKSFLISRTEQLADLQIRGNVLTVTAVDSDFGFSTLRSFDTTNPNRSVAELDPSFLDYCNIALFAIDEGACGWFPLGVDARNGLTVLADTGFIHRSGPAVDAPSTDFSSAWTTFGGESLEIGALSNDGNHAWLLDPWNPRFERIGLGPPASDQNPVRDVTPQPAADPTPPSYQGPSIDPIKSSVRIAAEVVLRGRRLETITSLKIGDIWQVITSRSGSELRFFIDPKTKTGLQDIEILSNAGVLRLQAHIKIVESAVKGKFIGTTKMLSKTMTNDQGWFRTNLTNSGIKNVVCTALVKKNAAAQVKREARVKAAAACSSAADFLEQAQVRVQTLETSKPSMPGRLMITFCG